MLISLVVNLFGMTCKFDWMSVIIFVCSTIMSYCFTSKKVGEHFDNLEGILLLILQVLFAIFCGIVIMVFFSMGR